LKHERRLKSIVVGGPGINFDYAHFLPSSPKCGVLHGHSAMVSVKVHGEIFDDMVLEFGELKKAVKTVLEKIDHKLVVASKYIVEDYRGKVTVIFEGVGGLYRLELPKSSVYIIEKDSTVENMSEHLAKEVMKLMPSNVVKVTVRMTEGFGKAAYSSI